MDDRHLATGFGLSAIDHRPSAMAFRLSAIDQSDSVMRLGFGKKSNFGRQTGHFRNKTDA
jgi:hypothetical protein